MCGVGGWKRRAKFARRGPPPLFSPLSEALFIYPCELSEGPIYIYLYAGEASGASFVNFTYRGNFARCARDLNIFLDF